MSPIHDQSYRAYEGERRPVGHAWRVIASDGIRQMLAKRAFLALLLVAQVEAVLMHVAVVGNFVAGCCDGADVRRITVADIARHEERPGHAEIFMHLQNARQRGHHAKRRFSQRGDVRGRRHDRA